MTDSTLNIGLNQAELEGAFRRAQQSIIAQFRQLERGIAASAGKINKEFEGLAKTVGNSANEIKKIKSPADQAEKSISNLDRAASSAGRSLQTSTGKLSAFAGAAQGISGALSRISTQVQSIAAPVSAVTRNLLILEGAIQAAFVKLGGDAFSASRDFQNSQIGLQKVLSDTDGTINDYSDSVLALSRNLGVAATDTLASVATFKQASFAGSEALQLAQDAIVLADVGSEPTSILSVNDAAELLTATLKGFGAEAADSRNIIDLLNEVSNQFAVSLKQLAIGFAEFSPIADAAGLSFQKTAAILTPAIEVFRSGSEVARAFRTAFLRLSDDSKEIQDALGQIGVSQRDANGQLRAAGDIYLDVAFAFQSLGKEQQLFLAGQLAGKDQAAKFAASINGLRKTVDIMSGEFDYAGSAIKEFQARQESADAATRRFSESLNNFKIAVGQETITSITELNNEFAKVFNTLEGEVKNGAALGFFSGLRGRIGLVAETAKELSREIPQALKQVDFTPFLRGIDGVLGKLLTLNISADGLSGFVNTAGRAFEGLGNLIGGVKTVIAAVAAATAEAAAAFGRLPTSVQQTAGIIAGAALVLANFRLTTLGLIGALAGLGGAFEQAKGFGQSFSASLQSSGISQAVVTTVSGISESFNDAFSSALNSGAFASFGDSVKSVFVEILAAVGPIVSELGRIVGETFRSFADALSGVSFDSSGIAGALSNVAESLSAVSITGNDVRGFIESAKSGFSELSAIAVKLYDAFKVAAGVIFNVVEAFLNLDSSVQGVLIAMALLAPVLAPLAGLIGSAVFAASGLVSLFIKLGAGGVVTGAVSAIGGFSGILSKLFGVVKTGLGLFARLISGPAGIIALGAYAVKTALDITGLSQAIVNLIPTDVIDAFGKGVDAVKNFFATFIDSADAAESQKDIVNAAVAGAEKIKQEQKETAAVTKQSQAEIVNALAKTAAEKGQIISFDRLLAESAKQLADNQKAGAEAAINATQQELTAQQQAAQIRKELNFQEQQLLAQNRQAEAFAAAEAKRQADELLKTKIAAREQDLSDARSKLSQIVNEEKQAAERIKTLRQDLAQVDIRTIEQIADVRRRGLSERRQQSQLIRDIETANAQAILKTFAAQRAQSEEEKRAAIEEAQRLNERSKNLAGQVQDTDKAVSVLIDAANTEKLIKKEQIELEKDVTENRKNEAEEQRGAIEAIKADIKSLKNELEGVADTEIKIDINDNIDKTQKRIDELKKQLADLERGVTIPIRTSGNAPGFNQGGGVGFAVGGRVSGPGGIDKVPAWLTAGEFVMRRAAVDRYGLAFMSAINNMQLPSMKLPGFSIPVARPELGRSRFATGGAVAGGGETVTFRFDFGGGREVSLFGPREAVKTLNTALSQLVRIGG